MTRLNNFDRLRWIECLCDDDVRRVFGESQNVKSRQELDARNSSSRAPTLHEAITTKFNDESWTPYTNAYRKYVRETHPTICEDNLGYMQKGHLGGFLLSYKNVCATYYIYGM